MEELCSLGLSDTLTGLQIIQDIIKAAFKEHPLFSNRRLIMYIEITYSIRVSTSLIVETLGGAGQRQKTSLLSASEMRAEVRHPMMSDIVRSVFKEHPEFTNEEIISYIRENFPTEPQPSSNLISNVLGSTKMRKYKDNIELITKNAQELLKSCGYDRRLAVVALGPRKN